MRQSGAVAALLIAILLLPGAIRAEEATSSPTPPKNLKLVGDHWTPWDPPEPGPDDYIIQKGDTLWDLSGKWLGDPFLWPQIWDKNRYILDSHWIYPGDPLVIPGKPTVVPPGGPPPVEEPETREPEVEPAPEVPAPPPLIPLADPEDLHCSGYITDDHQPSGAFIAGRELEREFSGQGDVVYINQGRNQGVEAGSEWAVIRPMREVAHPTTGEVLGNYVRRMGKIRVLAAQENTATAVISEACEDIWEKDELVPWMEMPIPYRRSIPAFDRYDVTPSGGADGYVVALRDGPQAAGIGLVYEDMGIHSVGTGHVIHVDLGEGIGVQPGDFLTLFRPNGELPRLMLGQAVILTVENGTSTAKVTRAVREIGVGDRVEVIQ